MADFAGRVVVVTGGAGAIGQAVARRFCAGGAATVLADVDGEGGRQAEASLSAAGYGVLAVEADVSRPADVDRVFSEALRRFRRLDVLVNTVGITIGGDILALTEEQWDTVLAANLKSYLLCSQWAGRHWRRTGARGRIVNVGSIDAELPMPDHAAYCVSKAGVVQLTRTLALALAPLRINVNCLNLGLVAGGMLERALADEAEAARLAGYQPWRRLASPEEAAEAVAYLASDAADFMTGSVLTMDGGRLLDFVR